MTVDWVQSTSVVVGYFVYRATQSGGPYTRLNAIPISGVSYEDTAVEGGNTYFYVVTAVDADGNESVFSNEAMAMIPTP